MTYVVFHPGRRCASAVLAILLLFLLVPATRSAAQEHVSGRVFDAVGHVPLPSVVVSSGDAHTFTDEAGRFSIGPIEAGATVTFLRVGYRTVELPYEAGMGPLEVHLERKPVALSEIAVEARAGEMLASGTSLAVQHADRELIESSGGTSVAESLDRLEGVSTSFTGAWGTRVSLRGLAGERVAVLLDGNRVSRACTYGMDQGLATVDPSTVERVEIVSGPGSALYGSGNVGGVINVVTRRAPRDGGLGAEVRVGGSSGVPGGSLGLSLGQSFGDVVLDGSVDGASYADYRNPEGDVAGSSFRQLTADLRADWTPASSQLFSLKGQYYAGRDIGWPMRGGAEIPEETRRSLSADWSMQRTGSVEGLSARAFFQRLDHHMVMSMIMPGMNGMTMTSLTDATSFSETSGGRAQARLRPAAAVRADVGVEVTHLLAEGTRWTERQMGMNAPQDLVFRTWPGVRILDVGAFAQSGWDVSERLTLNAGLRMDRVRRDADEAPGLTEWIPTGNLGFRLALVDGLHLRASAGAGYRTPDPLELYGLGLKPDGFVYRGSPDLDTERSLNTEATLAFERDRFDVSVTGFRNRLDDLVVPVLAGDSIAGRPVREYRGLGESTFTGLSSALSVQAGSGFTLGGSATWTRGEDPGTGDALPMVPPLEGGVTVRRDVGTVLRWMEVEWTGAARQDRVYEPAGEQPTEGWSVTHVRAAFEVAGTRVVTGVENVFDELYRSHLDPISLYRPGRNAFVRLSRTF
ncbi:MAG TPA: TonB-dependent receptor [Longimicrobiales bacterium]|nr:TonB-dependent receptor [Longimicrobiales bacterium]